MMKTLLKIAMILCVAGFALTSHAQSFEMLDIVKLMDRPAKQKASGKKSKEARNSRSSAGAESAIPAGEAYSSRTEVSVADKLINVLPDTTSYEVSPSSRQGELRFHNKQKAPAPIDPRLLQVTPVGRVDEDWTKPGNSQR